MKGQWFIISAVIATSAFLLISPLLRIYTSDYDEIITESGVKDAVIVLGKSGNLVDFIENNNGDGLRSQLASMLPRRVDFSVEIRGIPKHKIDVLTISDEDRDYLLNQVGSSIRYKNSDILVSITSADLSNLSGKDIFFMKDYIDLSANKKDIERFLASGGALFMVSNPTHTPENDVIMKDIFGLERSDYDKDPGLDRYANFNESKPGHPAFNIEKYYSNITTYRGNFSFRKSDVVFNTKQTIISDQYKIYSFVTSKEFFNGRSAWSSTSADPNANLTKSILLWLTDDSFTFGGERALPRIYGEVVYVASGKDPFEFSLRYWNVFI